MTTFFPTYNFFPNIYIIDMSTLKTRKSRPTKSYIVAIPSYDRPEAIIEKSLKTLSVGGVPKSLVHIFVANKAEEKRYKSKFFYHYITIY